ncbi:MAG TPA: WD40 repeat domain-containing protein [Gemmataceae bacterium]|jgi:WD40 repeat protein
MYLTKVRMVTAVLMALGLLGAGVGPTARTPAAPEEAQSASRKTEARKPDGNGSRDKDLPAKAVAFLKARPLCVVNQTRTVFFSPDGKWMAFVDYDLNRSITTGPRGGFAHTLHLRETASGKELWTVEQGGPFGAAAFSPDGTTLAVSIGETVRLWQTSTGKEQRSLAVKGVGFAPDVEALVFSPDGKALAAVSLETRPLGLGDIDFSQIAPMFTIWELATGKELQKSRGEKGSLYHLAGFSPDGKLLAWVGACRLTDLRTGAALCIVGPHLPCPFLSPDGKTCLWPRAVYGDYSLYRRDVTHDKELPPLKQSDGSVVAVAFCPDGKTVATSAGGIIRSWDLTAGKELHMIRGHSGHVYGIAFSPDGKMLASGGYDGKVFLWDAATGKIRDEFRGHRGRVESVYFSPDGKLLVSSGTTTNDKGQRQEETFLWKVTGQSQKGR